MITDFNQLDLTKQYTYSDYISWRFQERVELIRGWVFKMSPAPNVRHQRISGAVSRQIGSYLENKPCEVFTAPFDVRLPLPPHKVKGAKIDTVVQPDIVVICDPRKLDEQVGKPTARNLRYPVEFILNILAAGMTHQEILEDYPDLEEDDLKACLNVIELSNHSYSVHS